jgi:hypothetical protein
MKNHTFGCFDAIEGIWSHLGETENEKENMALIEAEKCGT